MRIIKLIVIIAISIFLASCEDNKVNYTVFFESNGGTVINEMSVSNLTEISLPSDLEKEGFNFAGWYRDDVSFENEIIDADALFNDEETEVTIYAKWNVKSYDIVFKDYDGSILQTNLVAYGTDLNELSIPKPVEREGYTFIGWNNDLPTTMIADNIELTAQFETIQYRVDFFNYDGTRLKTVLVDYGTKGESITYPENPYRSGYEFLNWDIEIPEIIIEPVTINATFTINEISIIHYEMTSFIESIVKNNSITFFEERNGYLYIGYSNDNNEHTALVMDTDLTVLNQYDVSGHIRNIDHLSDGNIIVEYILDRDIHYAIYDNNILMIDMHAIYYLSEFAGSYNFIEVGNSDYIFFRETSESGNNKHIQLVRIDENDETILYEFDTRYYNKGVLLSNDTIVFYYQADESDLETLVHIDYNGTVIFTEEANIRSVEGIGQGYMLNTFEMFSSYGYYYRDNESFKIGTIITSDYLFNPRLGENSIFFNVTTRIPVDEMEYGFDGTFLSESKTYENKKITLSNDEINEELSLHTYWFKGNYGTQYFDIVDSKDRIIHTSSFDYQISTYIMENSFYVYSKRGTDTLIYGYDFKGTIIYRNQFEGKLIQFMKNGNFIILNHNGDLVEITVDDEVVKEFTGPYEYAFFENISDEISVLSIPYNSCPTISSRTCPTYRSYIIDETGEIIVDYSSSYESYLLQYDELGIYFLDKGNSTIDVYNYDMELLYQVKLLYFSFNKFVGYLEGELVVIKFESIITPWSFEFYNY